MTLGDYVNYRNGVPLGHPDSLKNNLRNSFGAPSNAGFWKHWNPIWGYYLGGYVYRPLRGFLPQWLATLITFAVSGAAHDLAVGLLGQGWQGLITLWFLVMGLWLVVTRALDTRYDRFGFPVRVVIHTLSLGASLCLAMVLKELLLP